MKVKTFSKSHCYRLVRLVVAGNFAGEIVTGEMASRYGASSYIRDKICILSMLPRI